MVMYPADYKKELSDENSANATWIEQNNKEYDMNALHTLYRRQLSFIPRCIVNHASKAKIGALLDGDVSTSFAHGRKAIRPLIFSHGLGASDWIYTQLCKEYASHGYLVLMIQHQDGSCFHT